MKKTENNHNTRKRRKKSLISVPKNKKKQVKITKEVKTQSRNQESKQKKYISKERLRKRRKFMLISSLVLIVAITFSILSCTVFFPIKTIKIVDSNKYNNAEVINSLGVVKGDNLLLANESRATKALKQKYIYVEKVEFKKKLPFTLEVIVNEYEVFAQFLENKNYTKISKDGNVLEVSKNITKNAIVVTGLKLDKNDVGEEILFKDYKKNKTVLEKVNEIIQAFRKNKINGITLIDLSDMQDIRVTYKDRIVMLFGSSSNLDKKLIHAKATLEIKGTSKDTGTLNLSRIPSEKNEASFIPRELMPEEKAKNQK